MSSDEHRIAQYRVAVCSLISAMRGNGKTYMTWETQMLIRQIQEFLDEDELQHGAGQTLTAGR